MPNEFTVFLNKDDDDLVVRLYETAGWSAHRDLGVKPPGFGIKGAMNKYHINTL